MQSKLKAVLNIPAHGNEDYGRIGVKLQFRETVLWTRIILFAFPDYVWLSHRLC